MFFNSKKSTLTPGIHTNSTGWCILILGDGGKCFSFSPFTLEFVQSLPFVFRSGFLFCYELLEIFPMDIKFIRVKVSEKGKSCCNANNV